MLGITDDLNGRLHPHLHQRVDAEHVGVSLLHNVVVDAKLSRFVSLVINVQVAIFE